MRVTKVIAVLLVVVTIALAQDCRVSITTERRTSWESDEGTFILYDVSLLNDGDDPIYDVSLKTTSAFETYWEVKQGDVEGQYALPEWRNQVSLLPGAVHEFGYIIKGNAPAEFEVGTCDTTAPEASTEDSVVESTEETETEKEADAQDEKTAEEAESEKVESEGQEARKKKRPTRPPTKAPTRKPTSKPSGSTKAPTPTSKPTSKPTSAPSGSTSAPAPTGSGGSGCGSGSWWKPAPSTTWQWQLTGTIDQTVDVQMYDIDLFDSTNTVISSLHSKGRVVVCYFSTQYENWRPDASSFTSAVIGHALDGWAGEAWVDIRSPVVRAIMKERMQLAVSKGCDGIEPDNVDGYQNTNGLGLTAADQLDFNQYIATTAHSLGLSVGLKNDVGQAKDLQPYFDWALNEQCYQYSECTSLDVFITAGKAVFNTEYSGKAASVCPYMVSHKFSGLIKKLSLDASITAQCCTYQSNGCAKVAATCGKTRRSIDGAAPELVDLEAVSQFNDMQAQTLAENSANVLSHSTFAIFVVATLVLALF